MTVGPQRLDPGKHGRMWDSTDYNTGYRSQIYDLEVPDRQSHEPTTIRVTARETGRNRWSISGHHGPYEARDASGSYYRSSIEQHELEGPAGKAKSYVRKLGNQQFRDLIKGRSNAQGA